MQLLSIYGRLCKMRVIAGTVKGLQLKTPHGATTRPTTDLVRGALFSILESMNIKWNRALDLFAGSGALGIEALSRGAEQVDFVEQNVKACALIKNNLTQGELTSHSRVYCSNVNKALKFLQYPYDLIFMDPPYNDPTLHALITQLSLSPLLVPKGILVALHSSRVAINEFYGQLLLLKKRKHGDSCLSIFQKDGTV